MKKNLVPWIILGVFIIATVATAWWFLGTKRLVFDSDPERTRLVNLSVCTRNDIVEFNSAAKLVARGASSEEDVDIKSLSALVADMSKRTDYNNDASCQVMALLYSVDINDGPAATTAYENLERLNKKRIYPNPTIRGTSTLLSYKLYVDEVLSISEDGE